MTDKAVFKLLIRYADAVEEGVPFGHWHVYQEVRRYIADCERQARLDEHKILAGLDEEGRKQRYLELANE